DAPRSRVFDAYTDPKLIPLWWGPRRYTITVDKMDVRPGGIWRYISRGADGAEDAFNGEYREVAQPVRLVSTFEYEGMPGHIMVDTATFEVHGGKTKGAGHLPIRDGRGSRWNGRVRHGGRSRRVMGPPSGTLAKILNPAGGADPHRLRAQ